MYLIVHTPASLIIGSQINQPVLAFSLSFLAHLVLDIIPHDPKLINDWQNKNPISRTAVIATIDIILIIFFCYILYSCHKLNFSISVLFAIIGGIIPDALWVFDNLTHGKISVIQKYHKLHHRLHTVIYKEMFISLKYAILTQILIFIITLWVYLKII